MKRTQILANAALVCMLAASCAATAPENSSHVDDTPGDPSETAAEPTDEPGEVETEGDAEVPMSKAERLEMRRKLAERDSKKLDSLERSPAVDKAAIRGEVPEKVLEKITADLAKNSGAEADTIEVAHAEAVTWPDGSLGCGKPGQVYMQMLVPGYRVVLEHAGQQFDYRATEKGFFQLCEQPSLAAPGAGDSPPVE